MSEQTPIDFEPELLPPTEQKDTASYYWLGLVGLVNIVLGFIVSGILYFQHREKSRFRRHHLANMANFFLVLTIADFLLTALLVGNQITRFFNSFPTAARPDPYALQESITDSFYYLFLLKGCAWLAIIIFSIVGGTRAADGHWWKPAFLPRLFS